MYRGFTLVELLVSLFIGMALILGLYRINSMFRDDASKIRHSRYCIQSIRNCLVHINMDLLQRAYLLPQDLALQVNGNSLFIAGLPMSDRYPGLNVNIRSGMAPPYFAVVEDVSNAWIRLDTIDIDGDAKPDFWAETGIITDGGPLKVSHNYSRGNIIIPVGFSASTCRAGDRAVPAVVYELRPKGLYRNGQLLAESITGFDLLLNSSELKLHLRASHGHEQKEVVYEYKIR